MEKIPSGEPSVENKETEKKKKMWGKFRTLALSASLLTNAGFMMENMHDKFDVSNLEKGERQTIRLEHDNDPNHLTGQRTEFNLQKGQDGKWSLVGTVNNFETNAGNQMVEHPAEELRYELPPISAAEADALMGDITKASENKNPQELQAVIHRIIESADKGSITYYQGSYGVVREKVELDSTTGTYKDTYFEAGPGATAGDQKVMSEETLSLQDLNEHVDFKE